MIFLTFCVHFTVFNMRDFFLMATSGLFFPQNTETSIFFGNCPYNTVKFANCNFSKLKNHFGNRVQNFNKPCGTMSAIRFESFND